MPRLLSLEKFYNEAVQEENFARERTLSNVRNKIQINTEDIKPITRSDIIEGFRFTKIVDDFKRAVAEFFGEIDSVSKKYINTQAVIRFPDLTRESGISLMTSEYPEIQKSIIRVVAYFNILMRFMKINAKQFTPIQLQTFTESLRPEIDSLKQIKDLLQLFMADPNFIDAPEISLGSAFHKFISNAEQAVSDMTSYLSASTFKEVPFVVGNIKDETGRALGRNIFDRAMAEIEGQAPPDAPPAPPDAPPDAPPAPPDAPPAPPAPPFAPDFPEGMPRLPEEQEEYFRNAFRANLERLSYEELTDLANERHIRYRNMEPEEIINRLVEEYYPPAPAGRGMSGSGRFGFPSNSRFTPLTLYNDEGQNIYALRKFEV